MSQRMSARAILGLWPWMIGLGLWLSYAMPFCFAIEPQLAPLEFDPMVLTSVTLEAPAVGCLAVAGAKGRKDGSMRSSSRMLDVQITCIVLAVAVIYAAQAGVVQPECALVGCALYGLSTGVFLVTWVEAFSVLDPSYIGMSVAGAIVVYVAASFGFEWSLRASMLARALLICIVPCGSYLCLRIPWRQIAERDAMIEGVAEQDEASSDNDLRDEGAKTPMATIEDTIAQRCDIVAKEHGLTAREREALGYLARGRNQAYIEKQMVVSPNTAKTHIYHVYKKLDVHSKQELLDLVDGADENGLRRPR